MQKIKHISSCPTKQIWKEKNACVDDKIVIIFSLEDFESMRIKKLNHHSLVNQKIEIKSIK